MGTIPTCISSSVKMEGESGPALVLHCRSVAESFPSFDKLENKHRAWLGMASVSPMLMLS